MLEFYDEPSIQMCRIANNIPSRMYFESSRSNRLSTLTMRVIISFLLITVIAGFDTLSIPTPDRNQIHSSFFDDETPTNVSNCSVLSLLDMESDPNSLEFPILNGILSNFCVQQAGASKRQREAFDECIQELGDCDKSFQRNKRGDYLVTCMEPA